MRDGSLRIYQTSTWKMTYKKKISNEWFEDMKFSPNGEFLAVGSHDNSIYVFSMPTMALHKKIGKSSSYITHLDWSVDSAAIRTNDGSYELLFYEV
jgi:WD40 repeat protein